MTAGHNHQTVQSRRPPWKSWPAAVAADRTAAEPRCSSVGTALPAATNDPWKCLLGYAADPVWRRISLTDIRVRSGGCLPMVTIRPGRT